MRKILSAVAVSAALGFAAAPASAVVVAGIDFGTLGAGNLHLETMTLAQQFINPATTAPGTGAGQGYGLITTINGNVDYCSGGPCSLYYVVNFSGGTFTGTTSIDFTGTDVTIYYSNAAAANLMNQDSNANLAFISGLTPYATLVGHGNISPVLPAGVVSSASGNLSGASLNLFGNGLLDVDTADGAGNAAFEAFLDGSGIPDFAGGFADIAYTESSNNFVLNQHDVANGLAVGCSDGTAATGAWCWQGTLNTRGVAQIPEPGSVALLSLGLMLGGLVLRRRRTS